MANIDIQILKEFQSESKILITKMASILESCEGHPEQAHSLEEYGQNVDRIMGAAKSLALLEKPDHMIHKIADYSAICKVVGYKSSQIQGNEQFYDICVALLADGTEVLQEMIDSLSQPVEIKELFSRTFLDRLRWVSNQFGEDVKSSVDVQKGQKNKLNQNEIDELLKKLGID